MGCVLQIGLVVQGPICKTPKGFCQVWAGPFEKKRPGSLERPRSILRRIYRASWSPAKMSFLCVPPGTNSVPMTTVMTAITMAYQRPE